jgi:hypothetical protein
MQGKMAWASSVIAANRSSVPDPRLSDVRLLATGAYNFGETGMLAIYNSGAFPDHCASVLGDEKYFAGKLGVSSIFSDLS